MSKLVKFSLIGLIISISGLVYSFLVYGYDITDEVLGDSETVVKSNKVEANHINEIYIDMSGANLNIEPFNGDEIKVEYEAKIYQLTRDDYNLTMDQIGDTLHIELEQNKSLTLLSVLNDVEVNVLILNKNFEKISIHANVAEVNVNDVKLDKLNIEVSVGSVNLNDVFANQVAMEVTVGTINMDEVIGDLDMKLDATKMVAKLSEIN